MSIDKNQESKMIGRFTTEEIQEVRAAVFDTAVDIIYIFDIDSLQILDMNPSGLKELGYTIEEARHRDFYDLHAIEERGRVDEIIELYKRDGEIKNIRDLHLRRKDGGLIPVEKCGRITEVGGKPVAH
ncbi:MAG: PAS domain S-box protein [Actinobacteria bacterium]|nr:PAS domain S-box protein [Actinomycetota bacterium]